MTILNAACRNQTYSFSATLRSLDIWCQQGSTEQSLRVASTDAPHRFTGDREKSRTDVIQWKWPPQNGLQPPGLSWERNWYSAEAVNTLLWAQLSPGSCFCHAMITWGSQTRFCRNPELQRVMYSHGFLNHVITAWYINHGRDNKPSGKWSCIVVLTQIRHRHTYTLVFLYCLLSQQCRYNGVHFTTRVHPTYGGSVGMFKWSISCFIWMRCSVWSIITSHSRQDLSVKCPHNDINVLCATTTIKSSSFCIRNC